MFLETNLHGPCDLLRSFLEARVTLWLLSPLFCRPQRSRFGADPVERCDKRAKLLRDGVSRELASEEWKSLLDDYSSVSS